MPFVKISELPSGENPNGTELIEAVQSGGSVFLTLAQVSTLGGGNNPVSINGLSGTVNISGISPISIQTSGQSLLVSGNFYPNSNPSGFVTASENSGSFSNPFNAGLMSAGSYLNGYIDRTGLCNFICYGDSITAGLGTTYGYTQSWPAVLGQLGFTNRNSRVFNFGLTQQTTAFGLGEYSGRNTPVSFVGSFASGVSTITATNVSGLLTGMCVYAPSGALPLNAIISNISGNVISITGSGFAGTIPYNVVTLFSGSNYPLNAATVVANVLGYTSTYVDGTLNNSHQLSPNFTRNSSGYFIDLYGANDYYSTGDSITGAPITPFATWIAQKQRLWSLARADGYVVVALTLIPEGDVAAQGSPAGNTNRLQFNNWITGQKYNGTNSGWDYCFDLASVMPQWPSIISGDPFYSSDLLHPSASGEAVMGTYINSQFFQQVSPPTSYVTPFIISGFPDIYLSSNVARTNLTNTFIGNQYFGVPFGGFNTSSTGVFTSTVNIQGSNVGQTSPVLNMMGAFGSQAFINCYNQSNGILTNQISMVNGQFSFTDVVSGGGLTISNNPRVNGIQAVCNNLQIFNNNGSPSSLSLTSQFNGTSAIIYNSSWSLSGTNSNFIIKDVLYNKNVMSVSSGNQNINFGGNISAPTMQQSGAIAALVKANTIGSLISAIPNVDYIAPASLQFIFATGGTPFASSSNGPNPPSNAFDGLFNNQWVTAMTTTGFIGYQFPVQNIVTSYTVYPPFNTLSRSPSNFTFEGSNDGINYAVLDTRTGQSGWTNLVPFSYNITNPTGLFSYYRLKCTQNAGDPTWFGVGELQFSGIIQNNISIFGNLTVSGNVNLPNATGSSLAGFDSNKNIISIVYGQIPATATNDNAETGKMGEYFSSLIPSSSGITLTTTAASNVTSLSLTAGDWDIEGNVNFLEATCTATIREAGISTTSGVLPTDGTEVYNSLPTVAYNGTNSISLHRKRVSLSAPSTVYLVSSSTFSTAGTSMLAYGSISARRIR